MKLTPIVEELKRAGFRRVYGALELAALDKEPTTLPALFVVPEGENAAPNNLVGVHDQAAERRFGIVILVDGAARREDRISEELTELEEKVIFTLAGWTHPQASRACDYAGGRLLTMSASGRTLAWMVSFRTARHIRKVAS